MTQRVYTVKVNQEDAGMRLDAFVFKACQEHDLGISRTHVQKLIRDGKVTLSGAALKQNYKIKQGDALMVTVEEKKPFMVGAEEMPLDIVYEDDDVIVLNKPIGLVVHPAPGNYAHTLVNALLHHTKKLADVNPVRPGIVHRLDKDTSGLMVVAKTNSAYQSLVKQFSEHSIKREYVALVKGRVEFDEGVIDLPIARHQFTREKMAISFHAEAKEASTHYRMLKRSDACSLLSLTPHTGRTHQLRVHLASLGHPICGDKKYGEADASRRMALHARVIGFVHPKTKKFLEFSTEIPSEFLAPFKK